MSDHCGTCGHPRLSHDNGCTALLGGRELAEDRRCSCTAFVADVGRADEPKTFSYENTSVGSWEQRLREELAALLRKHGRIEYSPLRGTP